jgi:hypothetical protein
MRCCLELWGGQYQRSSEVGEEGEEDEEDEEDEEGKYEVCNYSV